MKPDLLSAVEAAQLDVVRLARTPGLLGAQDAEGLLEAQAVLERAREAAAQLDAELASLRAQAWATGHREGLAQATALLLAARQTQAAALRQGEEALASLALELARRIVGHHLEVTPEAMAQMVARTLTLARGRLHVEVRVPPEALARLAPLRHLLNTAAGVEVRLVEDALAPPQQCRIVTEAGIIEADLDTQLAVLAEAMGIARWPQGGDDGA